MLFKWLSVNMARPGYELARPPADLELGSPDSPSSSAHRALRKVNLTFTEGAPRQSRLAYIGRASS